MKFLEKISIEKAMLYLAIFMVIMLSVMTIQHKQAYAELCGIACENEYGESAEPMSSGFSCGCSYNATSIEKLDIDI